MFDETLTNQVCHNRASNTKPNACEVNAAAEVVGEEGNDLATHEVERKKPCKDFNENYKIQTKELFKPLNINIKCENR